VDKTVRRCRRFCDAVCDDARPRSSLGPAFGQSPGAPRERSRRRRGYLGNDPSVDGGEAFKDWMTTDSIHGGALI
jgi:hypothetical protein